MKIAVAGAGYVGLPLAVLLAQKNEVTVVDVIKEKAEMLNERKSPIQDTELEDYLASKINVGESSSPGLWATIDSEKHIPMQN